MFVIHLIKRNIGKHWKKSVLSVLISIVIILFLLLYIKNIDSNQEQLIKLGDTISVNGQVCNIDGSQEVGLEIDFVKIHKVLDTGLVIDAMITAQAYGREIDATEKERRLPPPVNIIGANTFSAFTAISVKDVTFIDHYDESFMMEDEEVCILSDSYLERQNLKLGDDFEIEMYAPKYIEDMSSSFTYELMGIRRLKVIGSYTTSNLNASDELPDILCSVNYIEGIYDGTRKRPYASSMSITLKDPLKMNDFKAAMQQIGFSSVNVSGGFSHTGKAITMNDQTFILAATQLKESLNMLKSLGPLILVIVVVLGFITSYLLMQSRRYEFAIMRSLGTSKKCCFTVLFLESMVLALTGSILGVIVASTIVDFKLLMAVFISVIFLITYLLGTAIALYLLNRFSVMAILTKTD